MRPCKPKWVPFVFLGYSGQEVYVVGFLVLFFGECI